MTQITVQYSDQSTIGTRVTLGHAELEFKMRRFGLRMRTGALVVGLGASLALSACAEEGAEGAEGVNPTHLVIQSSSGPDSTLSRGLEEFGKAIEEESDGTLTFEMHYAGAIAPLPEVPEAMRSGLLDVALTYPSYAPAEFPVWNALNGLDNVATPRSPIMNSLVAAGANGEYGFDEAVLKELHAGGIHPLLPRYYASPAYQLLCKGDPVTSLDEAEGKRVRASTSGLSEVAKAMGMSPVNLPFAEAYEGLQRGVIDCGFGDVIVDGESGLTEVADSWTLDPEVAFEGSVSTIGIRKATWDQLGDEGRRIVLEQATKVLLKQQLEVRFADTLAVLDQAKEHGVEMVEWDDEARQMLKDYYAKLPEKAIEAAEKAGVDNAEDWVNGFIAAQEKWTKIATELGYSDEEHPSWTSLVGTGTELDAQAFVDRYFEEIVEPELP